MRRDLDLRNKKAQVGLTLNWVPALIAVFIIVIGYLIFVVFIAAAKDVPRSELSSSVISSDLDDLQNQRRMEYLLKTPVKVEGREIFVRDLIYLWNNDKDKYEDLLEDSIKSALEDLEYDYYNWETEKWRTAEFKFWLFEEEVTRKRSKLLEINTQKYIPYYSIKEDGRDKLFSGTQVQVSEDDSVYVYLSEASIPWEVYS